MDVIIEKANRLIWQNRSRNGGTKLLFRAREIEGSPKIKLVEDSPRGHSKALIEGSHGEMYEAWLFTSGKVYCSCAFFADLEPFQESIPPISKFLRGKSFFLPPHPSEESR